MQTLPHVALRPSMTSCSGDVRGGAAREGDLAVRLVYTIADLKPSPQDTALAWLRGSIETKERAATCAWSGSGPMTKGNGVGAAPRGSRPAKKAFTQLPTVRALDWRSKEGAVFNTSGAAAGRRMLTRSTNNRITKENDDVPRPQKR